MDCISPPKRVPVKTPKYRSSCDACNDAKVRCDRIKPICGRCTKRELDCIYGISRRNGKQKAASFQDNSLDLSLLDTSLHHPPPSSLPSPGACEQSANGGVDIESDMTITTPETPAFVSYMSGHEQFSTWSMDDTALPPRDPALGTLSSNLNELQTWLLDPPDPQAGFDRAVVSAPETIPEGPGRFHDEIDSQSDRRLSATFCNGGRDVPSGASCQCHEVIILRLATLPAMLHGRQIPMDLELTQFKEAMILCKGVIECQSPSKNYTTVLGICILVGRMLCVVEAVHKSQDLGELKPVKDQNVHNTGKSRSMPFLSFGLYKADQEDEKFIHQEFWRLQTTKFCNLLVEIRGFIQELRVRQTNQDMSEMAICEELLRSLDQRAQALRQGWNATRATIQR